MRDEPTKGGSCNMVPTPRGIRHCMPGDVCRVAEIFESFASALEPVHAEEERQPLEFWLDWLARRDPFSHPVLVGEDERGRIWGWACLDYIHSSPAYRHSAQVRIYVDAAYHAGGHATTLLRAVLNAGRAGGTNSIVAYILATNARSRYFFRKEGFEEALTLQRACLVRGGRVDLLVDTITLLPDELVDDMNSR